MITRFKLRPIAQRVMLPVFHGESAVLVISGIGRVLSAAAVGFLYGWSGSRRHLPWINIGIAGHRERDVGELIIANKIIEQSSRRTWYPPQVVATENGSTLITADQIERDFEQNAAYDMEASGFLAAALRCSTAELVQSIKIVSDNIRQPPTSLNADRIEQLIGGQLNTIAHLADRLQQLSQSNLPELDVEHLMTELTRRWSFSVTQRHRLQRLLQRWVLLLGKGTVLEPALAGCRSAASVLVQLQAQLKTVPPSYRSGSAAVNLDDASNKMVSR
jgi:nucleoside phosphorylase